MPSSVLFLGPQTACCHYKRQPDQVSICCCTRSHLCNGYAVTIFAPFMANLVHVHSWTLKKQATEHNSAGRIPLVSLTATCLPHTQCSKQAELAGKDDVPAAHCSENTLLLVPGKHDGALCSAGDKRQVAFTISYCLGEKHTLGGDFFPLHNQRLSFISTFLPRFSVRKQFRLANKQNPQNLRIMRNCLRNKQTKK